MAHFGAVSRSRWPAALVVAAATLTLFGPSTLRANWEWALPVQITHASGFCPDYPAHCVSMQQVQVQAWGLVFGRQQSSDREFHAVVGAAPPNGQGGYTMGVVAYMHVGEDLDWATAFAHPEWIDRGPSVIHSWLPLLAVDQDDDPHVVEGSSVPGNTPITLTYRQRGTSTWDGTSDPVLWPCSQEPGGIAILDGQDPALHVSFGTDTFACGHAYRNKTWLRYTQAVKSTAGTDTSAWTPWVWLDQEAGGAPIVLNDGVLRFISFVADSVDTLGQQRYRLRLIHVWGGQRSAAPVDSFLGHGGWAGAHRDTLDTTIQMYAGAAPAPEDADSAKVSIAYQPSAGLGGGPGWLWITWPRFETSTTETYLMGLDVAADTTTARVRLTPNDGVPSAGGIFLADGAMHFIYRDIINHPDSTRLLYHMANYHTANHADLLNLQNWTPRTELTWANRTRRALGPSFVASTDSVWAIYASRDDDDSVGVGRDHTVELWFSLGHDVGTQVASGDTTTWSGAVYLDRDYLVASGKTLTIEPGTRVIAQANMDSANVGRDASKVELVVRGTLRVNGESANHVTFESVNGNEGDWGGILFDQAALAVAPPGYGYTCPSYVHSADIKDGTSGIAIRQTGAPSLDGVAFSNIAGSRHIVLDSTDVYVPHDGAWYLTEGTTVKAADTTRAGADIGGSYALHSGKVDLVVDGRLNTYGSPGNLVRFEPVIVPGSSESIVGDAWGGIFFDWVCAGAQLSDVAYADVGYAITPLSMYWGDAVVEDSRIHHFRDRAMWLRSSEQTGPKILRCSVFRDTTGTATLNTAYGTHGIVIEEVTDARIEDNTIRLAGVSNGNNGSALSVVNSGGKYGFCGSSTAEAETLSVKENTIVGPGGNANIQGTFSGIHGEWMCGAGIRRVMVSGNALDGWNGAGFDLSQSADLQMTCNAVTNSAKAIEFSRTGADTLGSRSRMNTLEINAYGQDSDQQAVRTDDAYSLKLGASGSMGSNQLLVDGKDYYVYENDENANHTLNAQYNYWRWNGTHQTNAILIHQHISKDSWVTDLARVDAMNALTDVPTGCSSAAYRARGQRVADDGVGREATAAEEVNALPERTELTLGGAVPSHGAAEIRFALAGAERRHVVIEVFTVTGRRVTRLVEDDLAGGRYGVTWGGTSAGGGKVGAGVYFVRMRAGEVTQVRKVVLVR
ncbi:MAG: hypothetical protein U0167_10875 [bacterium]